jgi:hypothetical protein
MPDTVLPASALPRSALEPALIAAGRQPALPGFLARSILSINWLDGVPDAWTLRWVIETCRAELRWSEADWRRLNPAHPEDERNGPHPSEAHRLPHERAAARVLNCWEHLHTPERRSSELWQRVKDQLRAGWRHRAAATLGDLVWQRDERAKRRAAFDAAVAAYRSARASVEAQLDREAA